MLLAPGVGSLGGAGTAVLGRLFTTAVALAGVFAIGCAVSVRAGTQQFAPAAAFGPSAVMTTGTQAVVESLPADRIAAIECLAQAVAYEAGNEPAPGREAVAQVILNRVRHRGFPKTICGVVYQGSNRRTGCQFSFTCDGSLQRVLSRQIWADSRRIAGEALDGRLPPTIGDATHYHADYVAPRWAPALVRIGRIGAHIFYHLPGKAKGIDGDGVLVGGRSRPQGAGQQPGSARQLLFTPWGLVAAPLTRAEN